MRISKERVLAISRSLVENLLKEGLITYQAKKELLVSKIESTAIDELQVEDRLNAEVKEIMKRYEKEMEAKGTDYQKMFQMVKKQLIKERDLIV